MRPTSVSCRRVRAALNASVAKRASSRRRLVQRDRRASGVRGFTLLELLLVLTLVALLTGLVAPRMWQWVQSARLRAELDSARAELEAQPRRAFAAARRSSVDANGPLALPAGWRLELAAPLVYEANGMTAGSRIRISAADHAVLADWMILGPAGTVRNAQPADGPFRAASAP